MYRAICIILGILRAVGALFVVMPKHVRTKYWELAQIRLESRKQKIDVSDIQSILNER